MDTSTHAPLRAVVACILSDERFKGRLVLLTDLFPLCNGLFSLLKPNAFDLAFAKSDYVSSVMIEDLLGNKCAGIDIEAGAVLAVKMCKRKKAVGVFSKTTDIPSDADANEYLLSLDDQPRLSTRQRPFPIPYEVVEEFKQYLKEIERNATKIANKRLNKRKSVQAKRSSRARVAIEDIDNDAPQDMISSTETDRTHVEQEMKQLEARISSTLQTLLTLKRELIRLRSRQSSADNVCQTKDTTMIYYFGGEPGVINIGTQYGFISVDDLKNGLLGDGDEQCNTRIRCGDKLYYLHNKYHLWTRDRAEVVDLRYYSHTKKLADGAKRLLEKFNGEQCKFDQQTQDILSAYSVAAYGASDWAKQSLICGTFRAVFHLMGVSISARDIADGCPSLSTIANWEYKLAAGTFASAIHTIKMDADRLKTKGMKLHLSIVTDHGNRNGIDHLVKVIIWSSRNEKNKRIIRRLNLDVDEGGHSTIDAADAIRNSVRVLGLNNEEDNLEFSHLHGDRGGGGAVQSLFKPLIDLDVLSELATWTNCMLHALQKALETASLRTFGKQGMNHKTPFQLCFLAIMLLVTVKKKGKRELLKYYYACTLEHLKQSEQWQKIASDNFVHAFNEIIEDVEETEDTSDQIIEKIVKDLDCPSNLMQPNFGRWGTVSSAAKVVLKHWTQIYFMAETIKKAEKSESYLYKIADSLLKLMTTKATPDQKNPSHYISLLFFRGFCEYFFDPHMEWFKRNDPVFGDGSYGQISRLVPEHLYIFFDQFGQLIKDDGWKNIPSFKPFLDAVDELPELEKVKNGGREYFVKVPTIFLKQFEESIHIQTGQWRKAEVNWMAIAGHPTIAKALVRWIFEMPPLPSGLTIEMRNHYTGSSTPIVNVNDCVRFITEKFEPDDLKSNSFVQSFMDELEVLAEGDGTIDPLDDKTWQGNSLEGLEEGIWNCIACCSTHQQFAENLVQTAAHIAKTNVEETRRSARAKNHFFLT